MKQLIIKLLSGKYDPVAYWNKRPNPNNALGESPARIAFDTDYISKAVGTEKSILELGPGVGRVFSAYKDGCNLTTLDISRKYSEQLVEKCKSLGLNLDQYYLEDSSSSFPFKDNYFSVGVASQVLLHIPPEFVTHSLKEIVRVCGKVVIITAYTHGDPVRTGLSHVFNHDYFTLFTNLGCAMHDVIMNEGRICFTVRKR